jgi:hypothetical protein
VGCGVYGQLRSPLNVWQGRATARLDGSIELVNMNPPVEVSFAESECEFRAVLCELFTKRYQIHQPVASSRRGMFEKPLQVAVLIH